MSFEEDYNKIVSFAKSKCFNSQLEAGDLVNDAYLNLFDKPYSLKDFYKEINNIYLINKHNSPNVIGYNDRSGVAEFSGDYVCIKCKKIKNAQEFRIEARLGGKRMLRTQCKNCEYELCINYNLNKFGVSYNKKLYDTKKSTEGFKKLNKIRFKNFVKKNRDKWNAYLRERYKQKKLEIKSK